jgi:hypothetical protein
VEYDDINNLIAYLPKEENDILVKEILFEKYWNEINSQDLLYEEYHK